MGQARTSNTEVSVSFQPPPVQLTNEEKRLQRLPCVVTWPCGGLVHDGRSVWWKKSCISWQEIE